MLRGFQWDLARQVERLDWLIAQLSRYADWGYNELYLHLEDAIEYPRLPGVARRDAYTQGQMERLVRAASRVGIGVVPIVNLLGHTQYLIKVPALRDLNELRATDGSPLERGQLCPVHPRTLEVAEKLLRDVLPFCTAGKVHVGLDESFALGRHPRSRAEIARIGRAAHFGRYVGRLRELTRSLGLGMGMWADMLYFLPESIPLLPGDVAAYEWYYYPFARRPRVELYNFRETDLGEQLRRRGFQYWGCPMNGAFRSEPLPHFADRLRNIVAWWRHCHRLGATGMLVTSWESYRLAIELTTVIDAAAASLWLDGISDPRPMLERGFARVFGKARARAAAKAAFACDRHPYSGYPRWEINSRWDAVSRRESAAPYRREERHFRKLLRRMRSSPEPLRASIALRWYLAVRDVLVRAAAPGAGSNSAFTSAWKVGRRAARAMWHRTRNPRRHGPNELMLQADEVKWRAGQKGEPAGSRGWQLCYRVANLAPAAQLVAVERQRDDGRWETLQACHTIEFQAAAARRRDGFTREHAAPVEWGGDETDFPRLRLAVRGLGQVWIEAVELVGPARPGRDRRRIAYRGRIARGVVGRPAPAGGWPQLDWTVNQGSVEIDGWKRTGRSAGPHPNLNA